MDRSMHCATGAGDCVYVAMDVMHIYEHVDFMNFDLVNNRELPKVFPIVYERNQNSSQPHLT